MKRYTIDVDDGVATIMQGRKKVLSTEYDEIIWSKDNADEIYADPPDKKTDGKAALIRVSKKKYIYVDDNRIFRWNLRGDIITQLYCPIIDAGANIYPHAVGKRRFYYPIDLLSMPKKGNGYETIYEYLGGNVKLSKKFPVNYIRNADN